MNTTTKTRRGGFDTTRTSRREEADTPDSLQQLKTCCPYPVCLCLGAATTTSNKPRAAAQPSRTHGKRVLFAKCPRTDAADRRARFKPNLQRVLSQQPGLSIGPHCFLPQQFLYKNASGLRPPCEKYFHGEHYCCGRQDKHDFYFYFESPATAPW